MTASISNSIASVVRFIRNESPTISDITKRITVLAVPIICMSALYALPTAEAGPLSYAGCLVACEASVFLAPACPFICAPLLGPYCP